MIMGFGNFLYNNWVSKWALNRADKLNFKKVDEILRAVEFWNLFLGRNWYTFSESGRGFKRAADSAG